MSPDGDRPRLLVRAARRVALLHDVDRARRHAGLLRVGRRLHAFQRVECAVQALLGSAAVVDELDRRLEQVRVDDVAREDRNLARREQRLRLLALVQCLRPLREQVVDERRRRRHEEALRAQGRELVELRRALVVALVGDDPERSCELVAELVPRRAVAGPVGLQAAQAQARIAITLAPASASFHDATVSTQIVRPVVLSMSRATRAGWDVAQDLRVRRKQRAYLPLRLVNVCSTTALERVVQKITASPSPPTFASTGVFPEPVTAFSWPRNGIRPRRIPAAARFTA